MIDTLPLSLRPILLQERKKLHWDWATFIFTATDPLGDTVLKLSVCSEGGGAAGCSVGIEAARSTRESRFVMLTAGSKSDCITTASRENEIWRGETARGLFAWLRTKVEHRWELWRVFTRNLKNKRIQSHRNKTKTFKNKKPFGGEKHFLPSPSLTETSNLTLEHTESRQKPETSVSRPKKKKKKGIAR